MPTLTALSLADLRLALDDLFEHRKAALEKSHVGKKIYGPKLENLRAALDAVPEGESRFPFAAELEAIDGAHDGYGAALFHLTEAYLTLPGAPEELVAAARTVRAAFVPELSVLRATYEQEVKEGVDHKKSLKSAKEDLEKLPVGPKGTAYDWAKAFVGKAEELGALLEKRGRALAKTSGRGGSAPLRMQIISVLTRFRAALADELSEETNLPADLDAQIFGYLDRLARDAAGRGAKAAPAAGTPPAATGGTDAGAGSSSTSSTSGA